MSALQRLIGSIVLVTGFLQNPERIRRRDERGLSQSTENAILLAGAVTIALGIIAAIGTYVSKHLPK